MNDVLLRVVVKCKCSVTCNKTKKYNHNKGYPSKPILKLPGISSGHHYNISILIHLEAVSKQSRCSKPKLIWRRPKIESVLNWS